MHGCRSRTGVHTNVGETLLLDLSGARPRWTASPPEPRPHPGDTSGAGAEPALIVLASDPAAVLQRLLATDPGRSVIDQSAGRRRAVVGLTDGTSALPQELVGATSPIDLLTVDFDGAIRTDVLERIRHLVTVGTEPQVSNLGWCRVSRVRTTIERAPLGTSNHLPIPSSAQGAELLSMEPVARALNEWLTESPIRADPRIPAWRETRFVELDGYATVDAARTMANIQPAAWIVYRENTEDGRSVRHHALLPHEVLSLLPERGSETELLRDHFELTGHRVVSLAEAPTMLGGGDDHRLLVERDSLIVAIVPNVDDVLRSVSAPRRLLDSSATRDEPPVPSSLSKQHLHVRGPESIGVGSIAELEVIVSGSDLGSQPSGLGFATGIADQEEQLRVHVRARAPLRVIDFDPGPIPVQMPGRSAQLRVVVEGGTPGLGSLQVSLLQGPDEIARVSVAISFVDTPGSNNEQITSSSGTVRPSARRRGLLSVHDSNDGFLSHLLMLPSGVVINEVVKFDAASTNDLVTRAISTAEGMVAEHPDGQTALDARLRGLGTGLLRTLLPADILGALWDSREELQALEVSSNLPRVPWELGYIQQPRGAPSSKSNDGRFLGHTNLTRSLPHALPSTLHLGHGRNRGVVIEPRYSMVPEAQPLVPVSRRLMRLLEATAPEPVSDVTTAVLAEGDFDIFHFSGHGEAIRDGLEQCLILDDSRLQNGEWSRALWSTTVLGSALSAGRRPLVFLNGCETGVFGSPVQGQGGFAEAFLAGGASAFIGAQWRITDAAAAEFAEAFYAELIEHGASLAEAASAARSVTGGEWSATPLAYAVYGDPEARIVRGTNGRT